MEGGPGPERDYKRINKGERAWMIEARQLLDELAPG